MGCKFNISKDFATAPAQRVRSTDKKRSQSRVTRLTDFDQIAIVGRFTTSLHWLVSADDRAGKEVRRKAGGSCGCWHLM